MFAGRARFECQGLIVLLAAVTVGCGNRSALNLRTATSDAGRFQDSGGAITTDARTADTRLPIASTPDVALADSALPDLATPDVRAPDLVTPDLATPDAPARDLAASDVRPADLARSDAQALDAATPDLRTGDAAPTDRRTPDASLPDLRLADAAPPDNRTSDAPLPDTRTPDVAPLDVPVVADTMAGIDGLAAIGAVSIATGNPFALSIQDNLLYVGDWGSDTGVLSIIDVSDPTRPRIVGEYSSPQAEIQGIAVREGRAYLANDSLGLTVVDVSTASNPNYVCGQVDASGSSYGHAVVTGSFGTNRNPYAMLGGFYGSSLDIYDITQPDVLGNPIVYATPNTSARDILDIATANDVGYLLLGDGDRWMGLETIDLGQLPSVPTRLGSVSLPVSMYGGWGRVRLAGSTLYFAASMHNSHGGGLRVIDVNSVRLPKVIGSLDIDDIGNVAWEGVGLDVAGSRVYILGMTALHILDVSNPRKPVEAMALPLPAQFLSLNGGNVVVAGDYAYAAVSDSGGSSGGIVIFRITAP